MSENVIIFDTQYTSEQVKSIERAQRIVQEAISTLKNASAHAGWKCPETTSINNSMGTITKRLGNLNQGIEATIQALKKGTQRFQELETRAENQSNNLSNNLRTQHGFSATVRGKNEKTNLPVTEVPRKEDSFIASVLKGTARSIIQGLGQFIGTVAGALGNGINKAGEGFLTDVKDGIIDPMANIFKGSYSLAKPPHDDVGKALIDISVNSIKLIGLTIGIGGDLAEKGIKLSNLNNFSDATKFIGKIYGEGGNAFDAGTLIGGAIKDPRTSEEAMEQFIGMIGDAVVPFGLDQTLIQGLNGITTGAQFGANIGNQIANIVCNFLGL